MEIVIPIHLFFLPLLLRNVIAYGSCRYELIKEGNETTIPQDVILNLHNGYRQKLLNGEIDSQPQAEPGSIKTLEWNSLLSYEALRVARTCNLKHIRINISDFEQGVGQNLFRSCSNRKKEPDWEKPIRGWFQENQKYSYPDEPNITNGHYTQLIWGDTQFVGCSFSQYIRHEKGIRTPYCTLYVCNYGPPGNVEGEPPYQLLELKNGDDQEN